MSNLSEVMTISQAGKRYAGTALTPSAIRRLVLSGEIPSRRIGAKYILTTTAIEHWLQGNIQAQSKDAMGIRRIAE